MSLPRRARIGLVGAALSVALLALTWYLCHYVGIIRRADLNILIGFMELNRPRIQGLTVFVATLCSPKEYVFLALIPVALAVARRRWGVAAMIAVVLLCANETTQLLKPLLAAPRDAPISDVSWPSGHATAAMTLALCMVIAAAPRWRPAVAAAMAGFALAVCYSFLSLGWHYPSDVLGGFLVAATWTLLGIAGLSVYQARRAARGRTEGETRAAPTGAGAPRAAAFSVRQALMPMAALLAVAAVCAGLVLLARPQSVVDFARGHETFVVGAAALGAVGLMIASGLTLMLRRG